MQLINKDDFSIYFELKKLFESYTKPAGVIHVGAHYGTENIIYNVLGFKNILFIEPLKDVYEKLKKNNINKASVSCLNVALGNSNQKIKMFVDSYNLGMSSSILKPKLHLKQYPKIKFPKEEVVTMIKMDSLNLNKYNVLVIDTQGYELEVLKGGSNAVSNFDIIITEVFNTEVYENCVKVKEVDQFLLNFNFVRIKTTWEGVTWGNALYVKKCKKV